MPLPRRVRARREGPLGPSRRVRPAGYVKQPVDLVGGAPVPFETGPRRLSAANPAPLTLELRANPSSLACEASQYVRSGVSPKRSPALLRFLASSTPSWL